MITTLACDTGVALILYELLKPVSRSLSLLAALFRLIFVVAMAVNSLRFIDCVAGLHGVVRWPDSGGRHGCSIRADNLELNSEPSCGNMF